jgi:hypothetical protein
MRAPDPDALWRPGFVGSWGYPEAIAPRRHRWWPWPAMAAAVLAVSAVVAGASTRRAVDPLDFPADLERRWSVTLPGVEVGLVARRADMVLLAEARGTVVLALDADDGAVRWEGRLPKGFVAELHAVDAAVVAVVRELAGGEVIVALDPTDGGPLWTVSLRDGRRLDAVGPGGLVVSARGGDGVELLDAATGVVLAAVPGDDVTWTRTHVRRRDANRLDLYDPSTLAPLASVALGPLGLGGRTVDAVVVDGGTIVAADDVAVLLDGAGAVRARLRLGPPGRDLPVDVHDLDGAGRRVAIQAGFRLTVVATDDGLRELWSDSAWLLDWHVDDQGQLVAVAGSSVSIVAFAPRLLDAGTGASRPSGPPGVVAVAPRQVFVDGGYIGLTGSRGIDAVVGYTVDRAERWHHPLDQRERAVLVPGGLVTVVERAAGAQVTLST